MGRKEPLPETMICFRKGAQFIEEDGKIGMTFEGKTQWVRDNAQGFILRQVLAAPRDMKTYADELAKHDGKPPGDTATAIRIAGFIVDYADYLQPEEQPCQNPMKAV